MTPEEKITTNLNDIFPDYLITWVCCGEKHHDFSVRGRILIDGVSVGGDYILDCQHGLTTDHILLLQEDVQNWIDRNPKQTPLEEALQDTWNDFVNDTGNYPDCVSGDGDGHIVGAFTGSQFVQNVESLLESRGYGVQRVLGAKYLSFENE